MYAASLHADRDALRPIGQVCPTEGSLHVLLRPQKAPMLERGSAGITAKQHLMLRWIVSTSTHLFSRLFDQNKPFLFRGVPKGCRMCVLCIVEVSRVSNGTAFQKQTDIPSGQVPQRRPPWGIFSCSSDKKRRGGAAQDWTFQRCQLGEELLLQQPLSPLSSTTREEAAAECYGFSTAR